MAQAEGHQTEKTLTRFALECSNLTFEPPSYAETGPESNSKSSHSRYSLSFLKGCGSFRFPYFCEIKDQLADARAVTTVLFS